RPQGALARRRALRLPQGRLALRPGRRHRARHLARRRPHQRRHPAHGRPPGGAVQRRPPPDGEARRRHRDPGPHRPAEQRRGDDLRGAVRQARRRGREEAAPDLRRLETNPRAGRPKGCEPALHLGYSAPVSKSYLRYALAVIFFANFLSYLDRQVVAALEHQLKHAFHLRTSEFGWVGSAFTVGYMVFAPIVGFLIARHRRPRVFAVCVIVWSLATIGSGLAPNKWILYATRFFIGAGEAGCLVIGPTLLSDYFSKEVRGRILSLFFLALPLGGATGYIAGALINDHLGWKAAFYIAGAPGFLVAALIWKLIDPTPSGEPIDPHHPQVKGIKPY